MPYARPLTLADGQLSSSSAIIVAGSSVNEGRITLLCSNTSGTEQTVVITFQRAGGTARRLARVVLKENEQAVLSCLPIQPDDTLLGYTTTAAAVDYLVLSAIDGPLELRTFGADGSARLTDTTASVNETVNGQLTANVRDEQARRLMEEVLSELQLIRELLGNRER